MKYSTKAIKAYAYLLRRYNDIDVYVEDKLSRNMYETLINRILEGKAKVSRVIQVGCREEVLTLCSNDQESNDRNRIYIIDGDFDLVHNTPSPQLKYFYRLNVYTSENLLWCKTAILQIAYECLNNQTREEIEEIINFDTFQKKLLSHITRLNIFYAIAHRLGYSGKTSGIKISNFYIQDGNKPEICQAKIIKKICDIETDLLCKTDAGTIKSLYLEYEKQFNVSAEVSCRYISGKTYLLPSIFMHLYHLATYRGRIEELKIRLSQHANLDIDPGLRQALHNAARGINNLS